MSAILKPEPLETIFDHGITDDELWQLTDGNPEPLDEYLYGLSQDSAYADLYRLYGIRGNTDRALYFMEQIQDQGFKFQFKARPCCAVHS